MIDYNYFNKNYRTIAISLSKQQAFDADPKAMQKINFTVNLDWDKGAAMFFIIEEANETILDFSQGTLKVLWIYFTLIWYLHKITQYNALSVKFSNSQINKLKSGIKHGTEVTLKCLNNQMLLLILMMRIILRSYYLIHKFQSFVKLFQIIPQLI